MRDLDETDRELIRLLLEDGRRSYSDLAEAVGLSAPAVSDRIDRLQEVGVIDRFTIDVNRSVLRDGLRVAVELTTEPGQTDPVREALSAVDGVERVFVTADSRLFVIAAVPGEALDGHFGSVFDTEAVESIDVTPLAGSDRYPSFGDARLGLECVECGNTVTSEGVTATIGGDDRAFCCESCEARFRERYERLEAGADGEV
ncbi:MAG: AsnC family transcriptional regulator [Natronomonas sp.]